jgi:glycosyltransferase involved in cell wall biosynthesis
VARLGIDATSVAPHGKGISRVQRRTVEALQALGRHELVVFARHPDELPGSVPVTERPALAWEQLGLPRAIRRHRLDAMLTWTERLPLAGDGRYLVWLFESPTHRVRQNRLSGAGLYQRASDLVTLALWKRSLRRAAFVLAGSNATRNAVAGEALVVYPGLDPDFRPSSRPKQGYVLAILSADPREDVDAALRVFQRVRAALPFRQLRLVVAGGFRGPEQPGVEYVGRVSDERLVELYQDATVYLDTSRYEGFGFQMLEAIACGTPVVGTNVTSIPEVVGAGGFLCVPGDEECLAVHLAGVLTDEEQAERLRAKGLEHARTFRWERTAELIAAAVDEVVRR